VIRTLNRLTLLATLVAAPALVTAHHSGVAFDRTKSMEVSGTVTRYVFRNPHLAVVIDVTNADGETEQWKLEGPGTTVLSNQGLSRDSIKRGDEITVMLHPMRSGRPGGLIQVMTLADGSLVEIDPQAEASVRQAIPRPSQVEYLPPPAGETWQDREAKTRPEYLPMVGSLPVQVSPGALDPDHLAKNWQEAPFDLTGTWEFRGEIAVQENYGWYEFKPHPEFTPKAQATYDEFQQYVQEGKQYKEPTAECYPAGMPRLMTRYGALMFMQYPTAIFILSRLNNEYRVIWMDGRERTPPQHRTPSWNGESIGRWEGDTLVVETEGFTDENHLIQQGIFTGDQLKITERISMLNDGNTIKMDFIMTDPEHWEGEWRHTKFRDRILRYDVREAPCLPKDNELLPGLRD